MSSIIVLIFGFILLWKGGEWLVDGATAIGLSLKIPKTVLGLSLIAFGTSAPELVVSILASFKNESDIIMGNIVGSNISNSFLILGVMGIMAPIVLHQIDVKRELQFNFLASALLLVIFLSGQFAFMDWKVGVVLLILFNIFMASLFPYTSHEPEMLIGHDPDERRSRRLSKDVLIFLFGVVTLPVGGHYVVQGAIDSAVAFGVSSALVSLFAVSLGTSLPELFTSIVASRKGEAEMALGNIVGSNIFNIFLILGAASLVSPVTVNPGLKLDVFIMFLSSVFLTIFLLFQKHRPFHRWSGGLFLYIYVSYIVYIFIRG